MKHSPFAFALFSILTLFTISVDAMNPAPIASVDWIESSDIYQNIYTIRCSFHGSYLGINGLIEVIRKNDLRTGKKLQLSGILYARNTEPLSLPFTFVTTMFDRMSCLHLSDLRNQEAQRAEEEKNEAKQRALALASKKHKTAWRTAY